MTTVTQRSCDADKQNCRQLRRLTRAQVLSILPQLEKLDEQPVSADEVAAARRLYPDLPVAPQSPAPRARLSGCHGTRGFPKQHHPARQAACSRCRTPKSSLLTGIICAAMM